MIRTLQGAGPVLKIILGGILVIICGGMVITLIPGYGSSTGLGTPARGILATIGDQEVTVDEVQRDAKSRLRQQFPQGGPQAQMFKSYFLTQAAEQLISKKAVIAEAHRLGLRVSDQEVREELQQGQLGATLFPGGKFVGQEEYENFVQRAFDLPIPQFEQLVKDDILIRKLQALVMSGAFVGDQEVRDEFVRRTTRVKFEYAVLTQADILKGLHPSDQELKAYYDRNKATYNNSIPEKRQIKYAVIDQAKIADSISTAPQDLQAYYDQHRDEYRVPEQVKVRHIVIKTPISGPDGKVDQKAMDAARAKAEDVLKQLNAGAKFEDMARKYSEDPSAKDGGLVGLIQPSRFPSPEVQKAAATLAKGATSGVINAGYAFVILHIEDRQQAQVKTLADVKGEIEEKVKQQKVARATEDAANALLSQARTDGLDKASAAKGVPAITTEFFSRGANPPGLAASPQLTDAIFSESEKSPPDVVQVPQGYVVFQLLSVLPPATPTFEEIHARVESEFKNERAGFLLQQKTQELSDRAKSGHDLKKAAKELGAAMKTSDLVSPDGQVPDVGSMSGAASGIFSLKPGEISGPINTGGNLSLIHI